jgi:hypothetical protein
MFEVLILSKNINKKNEPFDTGPKHNKPNTDDKEIKQQTNTNNRVQSKNKVSST